MGKQWLGHFQASRFGRGALHERCQRRQQKLDGLEAWHFSTVIVTLRVFLQLSLLFLGIALSANVWTQQHTVASVTMGTTAFGVLFYFLTFVASLKSPDCPFHTPMTLGVREVQAHCKSLAPVFIHRGPLRESLKGCLQTGRVRISQSIARFRVYLLSTLRHENQLSANDPEDSGSHELSGTAGSPEQAASAAVKQQAAFSKGLDLSCLDPRIECQDSSVESRAVQWILETSTDTDIVIDVARMVPEIKWPAESDITFALHRLKGHGTFCPRQKQEQRRA